MCALKIFLPPKSLRDLGAMKIFAGYHFFIPTNGSTLPRRRWASGRQGAARLDPTGISPRAQCFQEWPDGGAEPREWRTRGSQVLQTKPCAPNACKRDDCVVRHSQVGKRRLPDAMRAGHPAPLRAGHACAPLHPNAIRLERWACLIQIPRQPSVGARLRPIVPGTLAPACAESGSDYDSGRARTGTWNHLSLRFWARLRRNRIPA